MSWQQTEVTKLTDIVDKLQKWIDVIKKAESGEHVPAATFVWNPNFCSIHIDEVCLWEDQNSGSENCTIEYCKREWVKYVMSLRTFEHMVECPNCFELVANTLEHFAVLDEDANGIPVSVYHCAKRFKLIDANDGVHYLDHEPTDEEKEKLNNYVPF